ncbi:MAG: ABC transporter substrate-binding protein [Eubacteriales bacterium]|nr:ABC transporter substrate-binding protein [Eubacteriales bacterium]
MKTMLWKGLIVAGVFSTVILNSVEMTVCAEEEQKVVFTDLDGQEHIFEEPVDKVIIQWTAAGGPFFTMAALFGEDFTDHMVNLDSGLQETNADMWEVFVKDVPELESLPDFGSFGDNTFNMEAAVSSDADAVLVPLGLKETIIDGGYQDKFEAVDIPIVYIDFHAEVLEKHIQSIEIMGQMFGKEERAQELIDFYSSHVTPVYEKVEELLKTNERPIVHMEVGYKGPEGLPDSFASDYMWGKLVYLAGGIPSGEGVVEHRGDLQPEFLLKLDPDKIIFAGLYAPQTPGSIRMGYDSTEEETRKLVDDYFTKREGWTELTAYKNNEVYIVQQVLSRDIFDCATIEALAQDIWPEAFADLDPTATLQEFFEEFLPFSFGGNWFMRY